MVVRGGEDRERKSFPEAAGKKAPRVAGCEDQARHSILFPINLAPVGGIGGLLFVTGLKSSGEELTKQCWFGCRG